jgi:hypothetical protein
LQAAAALRERDAHALAHLGAVDAELFAAWSSLQTAASLVDASPDVDAQRLALATRAVVERAATSVIGRVGRALGPTPLATDGAHARRVADLQVYLRQSHAERDLEALGRLLAAAANAVVGEIAPAR